MFFCLALAGGVQAAAIHGLAYSSIERKAKSLTLHEVNMKTILIPGKETAKKDTRPLIKRPGSPSFLSLQPHNHSEGL